MISQTGSVLKKSKTIVSNKHSLFRSSLDHCQKSLYKNLASSKWKDPRNIQLIFELQPIHLVEKEFEDKDKIEQFEIHFSSPR